MSRTSPDRTWHDEAMEGLLRQVWSLWFGPELERRGFPHTELPPDSVFAAQAIWDNEGLAVAFNHEVKLRMIVSSSGLVVEPYLEGGLAHMTFLRTPDGWVWLGNCVRNVLCVQRPRLWARIANRFLPSPARRFLIGRLGQEVYSSLCGSALATVLGTQGHLVGSGWALQKVLEEEAFGKGVYSRRSKPGNTRRGEKIDVRRSPRFVPLVEAITRETKAFEPEVETRVSLEAFKDLPGFNEVLLVEKGGYSQEEVAERFGVTQGAISQRIERFYRLAEQRRKEIEP